MRVVLLCWEYPPRIVGKLSEYVSELATQLVNRGVETFVVTYHDSYTGTIQEPNGAQTTRVSNPVLTHVSLLTWVLTLNPEVERAIANIYYQTKKQLDLLDVHDWHFIPAAVAIKNALGVPFVYSVDSLEDHRSPNADAPLNMAIKGIEWLGFYEADKITAKSEWMKNEIIRLYKVPQEKIQVTPTSPQEQWVNSIQTVYNNAVAESGGKNL
ncbi:MAG: glycosyltransferase [Candidatus Bathyarchaeota archaeon]|nr:glycosyltransferase [Candidatus Bathyarchaeota archaeon]